VSAAGFHEGDAESGRGDLVFLFYFDRGEEEDGEEEEEEEEEGRAQRES